jgi:hypothetical protein
MRKLLIAAVAILVLAGGAMLAIVLQSGPGPGGGDPPPVVIPAVPVPAVTLAPQARVDLSQVGTGQGPPPPMQYAPPPPRAPAGTWEAVPPLARLPGSPAGRAIQAALAQVQPRLSACFDDDAQARHGQAPVTAGKEQYASVDEGAETILVLQVETLRDAVYIVDAPVESRGGASDGLIACAQQALRGQTFPAPGSTPGGRMRVLHNLVP